MKDIDAFFKRRKINIARLLPFGFSEDEIGYSYSAVLVDGQFTMTVTITKEGKISAEVTDNSFGESYLLHRDPRATGPFVGTVRKEYEHVLTMIADSCTEADVFKSRAATQIIQYVREKYHSELEFLWERFPDNAIFRRPDNAKWYAALLSVQKQKLGLAGTGNIEILDLRMKPEDVVALVDGKRYFPGYHMNKKYWVTICLDGSLPLREIYKRIDVSFALAAK